MTGLKDGRARDNPAGSARQHFPHAASHGSRLPLVMRIAHDVSALGLSQPLDVVQRAEIIVVRLVHLEGHFESFVPMLHDGHLPEQRKDVVGDEGRRALQLILRRALEIPFRKERLRRLSAPAHGC